MTPLAWLDGRILPLAEAALSLADPAWMSGMVAFETLRVDDGVPARLDAHLARLEGSAVALTHPRPDRALFRRIAGELSAGRDGRLRLGWTGTTAFGTLDAWDRSRMYAPVRAVLAASVDDPITWGPAKHTSRAGHVVRLRRSGADEVLFHRDGRLTEGTWSAVLGVADGALYSADSGVLPSISAAAYRDLARAAGVRVVPEGPPVDCPALYVCSSLRELCPVVQLDATPRSGWEPVGIRLRALSSVRPRD